MTEIELKTAYLHRSAIDLKTEDLTELKFATKDLISQATELLELVRAELKQERRKALKAELQAQCNNPASAGTMAE